MLSRYHREATTNAGWRFLRGRQNTFSDMPCVEIEGATAVFKREEPRLVVGVEPLEEFGAEMLSVAGVGVACAIPLLDGMLQDGENQATLAGPFHSGRISPLRIQHNLWNKHGRREIASRDGDFF